MGLGMFNLHRRLAALKEQEAITEGAQAPSSVVTPKKTAKKKKKSKSKYQKICRCGFEAKNERSMAMHQRSCLRTKIGTKPRRK